MDNTEMIQQIRERFRKRMSSDVYLKNLLQKMKDGTATLVDTDTYAGRIAECYNMALREVLGKASIEEYREAVSAVIPKGFSQITDRVSDYTMQIIDQQLQEAKIGMKAVPAAYDYQKERDVIEKIQQAADKAEEVSQVEPETAQQVESFAQKVATNTMQTNARAQNDAGLEVRVTRIYDGVGVHMRKDPCEWCLSRCGENMPYSEAYSKGAFERHPGCHCEIFYKPKRGGWQRQNDWKSNAWEDAQDPQTLRMRQRYGVDNENDDVTTEYLKNASPGVGNFSENPGFEDKNGERKTGEWLFKTFGGDIELLAEDNPEGESNPDYYWRKKYWDLKSLESTKEQTIEKRIRHGIAQIKKDPGGIIVDFTRSGLDFDSALQIARRYGNKRAKQSIDIIVRKGDMYKVIRVKK